MDEVSVQSQWSKQFDELPHMYTPDKLRGEHAIKSWVERDSVLRFIAPYMNQKLVYQAIKEPITLDGILWRILYSLGLARFYQRTACRLNLYKKYMDHRCMFCGSKHGIHWKIKTPDYGGLLGNNKVI